MTMDIDSPATTEEEEERNKLAIVVHPLAIVNMADQYTRITCGGSPLPKDFPVTGLLFGQEETTAASSNNNNKEQQQGLSLLLSIKDADDIPTDMFNPETPKEAETAKIQVTLHQAVFSNNSVVGWYRVSQTDDQPVANDLLLTRLLQKHYQQMNQASSNGSSSGGGEDTTATAETTTTTTPTATATTFVFALLQAPSANESSTASTTTESKTADADEELPLTLYQLADPSAPADSTTTTTLQQSQQSLDNTVLVGLDHWTLATASAEKIAVERVVREQPVLSAEATNTSTNNAANAVIPSKYVTQTASVQHSLVAIQDRLAILVQFLQDTEAGRIPVHHSLLRQVQGLLCQLGPVAEAVVPTAGGASQVSETTDTELLQQLAVLGKTVDAVAGYTEKFRMVQESRSAPRRF